MLILHQMNHTCIKNLAIHVNKFKVTEFYKLRFCGGILVRNRSMALVVRDDKILMIKTFRFNRYIWELPGGGIEIGETAEEAAIRELKEECGLEGVINRPLNTLHCKDGSVEYVFLVDVSEEQEAIVGIDPEVPAGEEQSIKNVCWKKLNELSEKDRAFLWSYGLLEVDDYFELVLSWGDEISYPLD